MSGGEHHFDESLISGYVDGELTQGDEQRVRLHLESCRACRLVAEDLRQIKEATMTTDFALPADTQWDETPRTPTSRALLYLGWGLAVVWLVGVAVAIAWQVTSGDESARLGALLGAVPLAAIGLIVLSALVDRLQTRTNDPYRKVQK